LDGYDHLWEDHQEGSQEEAHQEEARQEEEDSLGDSLGDSQEVEDHPHRSLFPQHRSSQEDEEINL
jgi:hypothetical protein